MKCFLRCLHFVSDKEPASNGLFKVPRNSRDQRSLKNRLARETIECPQSPTIESVGSKPRRKDFAISNFIPPKIYTALGSFWFRCREAILFSNTSVLVRWRIVTWTNQAPGTLMRGSGPSMLGTPASGTPGRGWIGES